MDGHAAAGGSRQDLIKEIDHLAKLAQKAQEATATRLNADVDAIEKVDAQKKALAVARKIISDGKKHLAAIAEARVALTDDPEIHLTPNGALKRFRYFEGQADWLLSRFPEGRLRDVEGLVKLVDQAELAENDYSLTPGRYVGVAPEEDDEDFDFEEAIKEIHDELETLNAEAADLAETIAKNFAELIV